MLEFGEEFGGHNGNEQHSHMCSSGPGGRGSVGGYGNSVIN